MPNPNFDLSDKVNYLKHRNSKCKSNPITATKTKVTMMHSYSEAKEESPPLLPMLSLGSRWHLPNVPIYDRLSRELQQGHP